MIRLKIPALGVTVLAGLLVVKAATAQPEQHVFNRQSEARSIRFFKHVNSRLRVTPINSENVDDAMTCAFTCLDDASCVSYNMATSPDSNHKYECQLLPTDKYNSSGSFSGSDSFHHYSIESPCDLYPCKNGGTCRPVFGRQEYTCDCPAGYDGKECGMVLTGNSPCGDTRGNGSETNGVYRFLEHGLNFTVYCHSAANKSWTLIARFSNKDAKTWVADNGAYWYDRRHSVGQTTNPAHNGDMVSPAFWFVSGTELKITRSDDSNHTALLQTTGNCLGGHTFRSKITSYGNFRNGVVWASDRCLGSCNVQYGGLYNITEGFEQHSCNGGFQSSSKIGFWCDWGSGDGAVLMIGGGGSACARADHGVGITEANSASFVDFSAGEHDFGRNADNVPTSSYSLNMWIG